MQSERDGDRLDAAIDAAARSLTAGEPSAALRASVGARIGRRNSVRWLVPAAAMAALIAVVLVGRTTPPHRSGAMGAPGSGPASSGGPDAVRLTDVRPTDVRLTIDRATTVGRALSGPPEPDKPRPTGGFVPIRQTAETFELPPLEEPEPMIEPLTIELLETSVIAVDSSGVMPIEIEPLQIEPLRGD